MFAGENEHPPPYFHAEYAEHKAQVDIASGKIIEGKLPPRQAKLVVAWADVYQDELMANWELLMNYEKPFRIEPL